MENDNKDTVNVEETKVEETTEKTYTQTEIDNSYKTGYSKAKKELKESKEYKDFMEWKKNNQNDSEKLAELQSSVDSLKKENNLLKATNKVAKNDVKPEFLKFVTSEVMSMVNDTTDFDTALKNYKKENTQYFGETVVKKVQSSPSLVGGAKPQTTSDIVNNVLRGAIGK